MDWRKREIFEIKVPILRRHNARENFQTGIILCSPDDDKANEKISLFGISENRLNYEKRRRVSLSQGKDEKNGGREIVFLG